MVQYILECIAFQLVFLIIYDLFLKRETFFQWNRLYLIGTYVISMILPWVKIEAMKETVPEVFQEYPAFLWNLDEPAIVLTSAAEDSSFSISWEYAVLFGGMLVATVFFGYKLHQIYALKRKGEVRQFKDFTRIIVSNSAMAFSFFKSIFLGDKVIAKEHQSIIAHELVHIKQRHSYDLLFFELMRIVGWFNPLVYVYQIRLAELHEFIADAQVAKTNKKEQYQLLLSEVFQTQHISFINQFFKTSLIKKRIVMLQKTQSKKIWQLKYLLLVPIVFGMLAYTSIDSERDVLEEINIENNDDKQLILEVKNEIEKEIETYSTAMEAPVNIPRFDIRSKAIFQLNRAEWKRSKSVNVLTKRGYFRNEIVRKMYYQTIFKAIGSKDEEFKKDLLEFTLPSTNRYESYVRRKKAFEILDVNLKYSVGAYEQDIIFLDKNAKLPKQSLLFEVANVKDLTGVELRTFNTKLEEVFEKENSKYTRIILTDSEYFFEISTINEDAQLQSHLRNLSFRIDKKESDTIVIQEVKKNKVVLIQEIDPVPFATVEKVPVFPGCEDANDKRNCFNEAMSKHVVKHFRYPKEAYEKGIQGKVFAQFTITKKGDIKNLRLRGPDSILEQEVSRIIGKLPKMKPGKHKGKKVAVPYSIPITFKLQASNTTPLKSIPADASSEVMRLTKKYNELAAERNRIAASKKGDKGQLKDVDDKLFIIDNQIKEKTNEVMLEVMGFPFAVVEEVPIFPGCENEKDKRACFERSLQKHVVKNFNYPKVAQDRNIQGKVYAQFVIAKNGHIDNLRLRGPDSILEQEVSRIIRKLPKMIPGKNEGKAVRVPYSIPISFKLQEDSKLNMEKFKLVKDDELGPLVIIDGKESTSAALHAMDTNQIESMNVLKNEAATNAYGEKGKNGVIVVKTKN